MTKYPNFLACSVPEKLLEEKLLRTVPPVVTAHTFCASRIVGFLIKEFASYYNNIFSRFMTTWKKQNLARAIRIQKENWG